MARKSVGWLIVLVLITGCRGCQSPFSSDRDNAKSKAPSVPIARLELSPLESLPAANESEGLTMKPGHWYELQQSAKANESDEALYVGCTSIERAFPFRPIPILELREPIQFERKISLARGQRKELTTELFFPRMAGATSEARSAIRISYQPRMLGAALREEAYPVNIMPDYQYYLVVLSTNPSRYQFLHGLSSIVWPSDQRFEDRRINPFRVIQIAQSEVQNSLPTRLMTWTSTSHLMWNDCLASSLVESQQQSLIDWLHFGGQIIVNGPESQAALNASFLSDYLPLRKVNTGTWEPERWKAFSRHWSIARGNETEKVGIRLSDDRHPPLISGELAQGARWVAGCEGLVAERFIGGGRIVMTTFPLDDSLLIRWPSYSSFFNGALLHRPPRVWRTSLSEGGDLKFAGAQSDFETFPTWVSRVRLLSRDLGRSIPEWTEDSEKRSPAPLANTAGWEDDVEPRKRAEHQGVAQIESDGLCPLLAKQAILIASGIQVPRIQTIIQLLSGYFIVLVPMNWLVFRLIGRVEFAWLAAPIIAIVGAVVVARAVQLDVGFSRSQTTLNYLDLKSGYSRGHLSSFISLYTSLSTRYGLHYLDNRGILLPLAQEKPRAKAVVNTEESLRYDYGDEEGAGLSRFPVRSNSTSLIRGEEVYDAGGAISIRWEGDLDSDVMITHEGKLTLRDAAVIARTADGQLQRGWIGPLEGGTRRTLRFSASSGSDLKTEATNTDQDWQSMHSRIRWHRSFGVELTADDSEASNSVLFDRLGLGRQLSEIALRYSIRSGEAIVLGWTDQPLSGLNVEPRASQREEATIVVVQGLRPDRSAVGPDINLPAPTVEQEVEATIDANIK